MLIKYNNLLKQLWSNESGKTNHVKDVLIPLNTGLAYDVKTVSNPQNESTQSVDFVLTNSSTPCHVDQKYILIK